MLEKLKLKIDALGKSKWQPLLHYVVELHEKGLHSPFSYLPYMWEDIAPGQFKGGVFGNWDTLHIAWNHVYCASGHAKDQIFNILSLQGEDGFLPGSLFLDEIQFKWNSNVTFPPLWPIILQEYYQETQDDKVLKKAYPLLVKQLQWFENNRQTPEGGFYYIDILDQICESGVENSPRFIPIGNAENIACIDATSHIYSMYEHASCWSKISS